MGDEEYDLSDSEDEALRVSTASGSVKDEDEASRAPTTSIASSIASVSKLESEHSEWFRVESGDSRIPGKADDSETEEDNDSDNYDLNELDTVGDDDGDEWLSIPKGDQAKGFSNVESNTKMETQSSDGFDVIEAPQIRGAVVGFCSFPTFTND
jgi:hypothetical protein